MTKTFFIRLFFFRSLLFNYNFSLLLILRHVLYEVALQKKIMNVTNSFLLQLTTARGRIHGIFILASSSSIAVSLPIFVH
jgi:hypothetical protein